MALSAIRPATGAPSTNPAGNHEDISRLLYDGGTKDKWDITHTNYDSETGVLRSVTGYTRQEHKDTLGCRIRGGHGFSIHACKDFSDVSRHLGLALRLYEDMAGAVPGEETLLALAAQQGWTGTRRTRLAAPTPSATALMPHTLRQAMRLARPVKPADLYSMVAESYGTAVMEATYYGRKLHRWNFKRLVRRNLEEAVELGLADRHFPSGCYTVTPLGRETCAAHASFTEDLLNKLCAR